MMKENEKEEKNMIKMVKEKFGFVSLETVVVTGVVIALGLYGLKEYQATERLAADAATKNFAETILLFFGGSVAP